MTRRETGASLQERATQRVVEALDSGFFRALAEPTRIEILKLLILHGATDIGTLARQFPQDRSVLSRHLQVLLQAGIVACTKDGRRRVYGLRGGEVILRLETMLAGVRSLIAVCCPEQLP